MPHNANWKRNVGFFIGGQFLSLFGSMLVQFAITWQITLQTQSGVIMSMFSCASLLPMVIISPFAGVWADRYNRKYLINISDGIIALVTALLAILMLFGYQNIWLMLGAVAVRSFGQGVQQPPLHRDHDRRRQPDRVRGDAPEGRLALAMLDQMRERRPAGPAGWRDQPTRCRVRPSRPSGCRPGWSGHGAH